jgi:hypothetical protein
MPKLTRWTVRIGMLYLLLGLLGWLVYTYDQVGTLAGNWSALRPVSIHFITVGWLTQIIFAVMYWMFPIISRENPYGEKWIPWLGFWGLNLGLWFRALFEIGLTQGFPTDAGWGLIGAGFIQWGGVTAWIIATWGRVRERGGR